MVPGTPNRPSAGVSSVKSVAAKRVQSKTTYRVGPYPPTDKTGLWTTVSRINISFASTTDCGRCGTGVNTADRPFCEYSLFFEQGFAGAVKMADPSKLRRGVQFFDR